MSNIMKTYQVTFSVNGKTELKKEIVKSISKKDKDIKSSLLPYGYDVDEIINCYEIQE